MSDDPNQSKGWIPREIEPPSPESETAGEFWVSDDDGSIWYGTGMSAVSFDECEVANLLNRQAAELRELRKDKERLDWIEANQPRFNSNPAYGRREDGTFGPMVSVDGYIAANLRTALDTARESAGEKS